MPKIVIREFDKTTAGGAAYANFAVVVPGFVSDSANLAVFDENGVYECTNKEDFKKNVGLVKAKSHPVAGAKAPTRTEEEGWDTAKALTEEEFLIAIDTNELFVATTNTSGTVGECKDEEYEYARAKTENNYVFKPQADSTGDGFTLFMKLTDVGHDALTEDHYGNQIAYELLGLGYTVLYKKIDDTASLSQETFWRPLKDKTLYDFRYLLSGVLSGNVEIYAHMVDVANFTPENANFDNIGPTTNGRGDCIALLDIDENYYQGNGVDQEVAISQVLASVKTMPKSKYAAVFAPSVKYASGGLSEHSFYENQWFPASFHYLACAARSSELYNEWYANAGYTRGISKYTIETVGCNFGEAAVNMFQRRASDPAKNILMAINPIINLRGTYYLWGNRTAEALGAAGTDKGDLTASHFLNIRQLCSTIKKKVYVTCRQVTFDPNSDLRWVKFCNSIKPLLEKMKADQGIADYKFIKVKSKRKAFLSAIIRIVPIEAVEDFDISIYLEDSLSGVIATTEE